MFALRSPAGRGTASISYVCLSCRLRLQQYHEQANQRSDSLADPNVWESSVPRTRSSEVKGQNDGAAKVWARSMKRDVSTKWKGASESLPQEILASRSQQNDTAINDVSVHPANFNERSFAASFAAPINPQGIRAYLREWQEAHKHEEWRHRRIDFSSDIDDGESMSNLARLPDHNNAAQNSPEQQAEDDGAMMQSMMLPTIDDLDDAAQARRFLSVGDLVELTFPSSERESVIAVYVRRSAGYGQFFTINGKWMHVLEKQAQYSIPGWFKEKDIEPLLEYLPDLEHGPALQELIQEEYVHDLSVPRSVSGPLVSRMVQFHSESQEIYRRHAKTLDNAHDILAHETDLRYGSLVSAATALLGIPSDELPVTAIHTTRKALKRAEFAFNFDERSHRLTGYMQIRSKEQLKMIRTVRSWFRAWQDDLALVGNLNERERSRHRPSKGAQHLYNFIEKAKKIITQSREHRDVTASNIGPSKMRHPITPKSDCVKVELDEQFTEEETDLVRFVETWSLNNQFAGDPRLAALPPLLLQKVGLYEDFDLIPQTGMVFLQELGTIMPYENRMRYDPHLLLPSSQHSKPLQNLMTALLTMKDSHNFEDSMKDLRHDWGDLPVYCIDGADAQEIDDGISIERADFGENEEELYWVHIHVANPTAFFTRDHPLAKMARHMGETIYMPERAYMMMPRWATNQHFSLDKNRPCLTFSAKMGLNGMTLEQKITPGIVRNVIRLTHEETADIMGVRAATDASKEVVVQVGGTPPPSKPRRSRKNDVTPEQVEELKVLDVLARKRSEVRRAAGGLFFEEFRPEVNVWQNWNMTGLAWDHPYRKGSRTVEGDPVIQMRTRSLRNWFAPSFDVVDNLVREMMLLACETGTSWCAERRIPTIYRGTIKRPDQSDADKYRREVLEPAAAKNPDNEWPMHLAYNYIQNIGQTVLSTKPLRHRVLGMNHYGKVTSPLRRYGDMVAHWQIEAALREEARTGSTLVTHNRKAKRDFLPFSSQVLETIILGLQPREQIVSRTKKYSSSFWIQMLLFRAIYFNEAPLPLPQATAPPCSLSLPEGQRYLVRFYIHTPAKGDTWRLNGLITEMNLYAMMERPESHGLEAPKTGDLWEAEIFQVNCYRRSIALIPIRLLERAEVSE